MDLFVTGFLAYGWQNYLEWILRIIVATLCGGIIGYERSKRFKEAGIRTHCIVALASAVFIIVSKYAFADMNNDVMGTKGAADPSRIASQIVTGIGFLGAGAILQTKNYVKGLTTSAGVFATAAVGMAVGSGLYVIGIVATLCLLLIHIVMHKFQFGRDKAIFCTVAFKVKEGGTFQNVVFEFAKQNDVEMDEEERNRIENIGTEYVYTAKFFGKKAEQTIAEMEKLFEAENLLSYTIKRL